MTRRKSIKNVLSILLLALFCWYMGGITVFPHVHIVDGVVICHSHPYSGTSDNPGHSHSSAQFETIAQLSLVFFVMVALFGGLIYLTVAARRIPPQPAVELCRVERAVQQLRGPPYC